MSLRKDSTSSAEIPHKSLACFRRSTPRFACNDTESVFILDFTFCAEEALLPLESRWELVGEMVGDFCGDGLMTIKSGVVLRNGEHLLDDKDVGAEVDGPF